jgi:WhiB family redox-sensing transcriptional regulator
MIRPRETMRPADAGLSYPRGEDWRDRASCLGADTEAFFADGQGSHVPEAVKRICRSCPVRQECIDDALVSRDQWAIRGGVAPRDRRNHQPGDDIPIRTSKKASA